MIGTVRAARVQAARSLPAVRFVPGRLTVAGAYLLGAALMAESDHAAAVGFSRFQAFGMLDAGVIVIFVATAAVLAGARATFGQRALLTSVFGAVGVLPKLLRSPTGPIYFDELAHWRQAHDLAATGVVGAPNSMVPIISAFPGIHDLTASIVQLSGLSTWTVAELVVTVSHAAMALGVFMLVRLALPDRTGARQACRIAGIATVVYAANPEWMFFDSMFAYETLALPLALWAVVMALAAIRSGGRKGWAATAAAALLAFATATTHHITSGILACALLLLFAGVAIRSRGRARIHAVAAGLVTTGVIGAWLASSTGRLDAYLGPYASSARSQAATMVAGSHGGGAQTTQSLSRSLLTTPQLPHVLSSAGLVTPFVIMAAVGIALLGAAVPVRVSRIRATAVAWWASPGTFLLAALAVAYAVSFPLLMTASGNQLVRRSWDWSWIGVGFAVAVVAEARLRGGPRQRPAAALVATGLLAVIVTGGLVSGVPYSLEEPAAYLVGDDPGVRNTELLALSRWTDSVAPGRWIVTDRFTEMALASYGGENWVTPQGSDPVWTLVRSPSSAPYIRPLRKSGVVFLVIDDRMATTLPASGFWYEQTEPASVHDRLVPVPLLRRFDCLPFSHAVYSSAHYTVYRFDLSAYSAQAERRVVAGLERRARGGVDTIERRSCP